MTDSTRSLSGAADLLARHRNALASAVATGVVTGAFPPRRWPGWLRRGMHGLWGASSAAGTFWILNSSPDSDDASEPIPTFVKVAAPAAIGAASVLLSVGGTAVDTAIESALERRGLRRPRLWIGVGAAGLSLALGWLDKRLDPAG